MCYEVLIVGIDTASFALANIALGGKFILSDFIFLFMLYYLCIYTTIQRYIFSGIISKIICIILIQNYKVYNYIICDRTCVPAHRTFANCYYVCISR